MALSLFFQALKRRSPFRRGSPNGLPRVYIHVGPHKTGTTSIQHVLLNAVDLICYPTSPDGGPGHHGIARELKRSDDGASAGNPLLEAVRRDLPKVGKRPFVLSSEDFTSCAHHPRAASRFGELADSFHLELIITHRPLVDRLYSLVQEDVKHGSIQDFIGNDISWESKKRHRYLNEGYIDKMLGLCGWRNCHIVMSDPANSSFIVDAFSTILGVSLPVASHDLRKNERIPYMQMIMLVELHRENPGEDMHLLLDKSKKLMEDLTLADPAKAATPYPPIPEDVRRHFEAVDKALDRRMLELELQGRMVVHRP